MLGDIGLAELTVIAFVAVLVFGPERLPEFARQAGVLIRRLRGLADTARDELRNELGDEFADLELRDLDPRAIVRKHITEAMAAEDAKEAERQRAAKSLAPGAIPPFDVEAT